MTQNNIPIAVNANFGFLYHPPMKEQGFLGEVYDSTTGVEIKKITLEYILAPKSKEELK